MTGQQPVKNDVASPVNSTTVKTTLTENGSSDVLNVILAVVLIALILVLAMMVRARFSPLHNHSIMN